MKKVKIGLIGAGEVAQNFHLPIFYKVPNTQIVAIYDKNRSKAKLVAEKYGIKHVARSIEELLNIEDINAVDICTPTDTHLEIAKEAIASGKNLLIEKPAAKNLQETIELNDLVKKSNSKVMIGINQRFRFDAKMMKSFVQMGEIGKVFYIQTSWLQQRHANQWRSQLERAGGGVLIDLGYSMIDSLLWIYDFKPVKSVSAKTFKHHTKHVEDICIGTMNFEDGSVATMEISWSLYSTKNSYSFNIFGSDGSAKVNPLQLYKKDGSLLNPITNIDKMTRFEIHKKSFESEIKHFVNAMLDLGPVISTAEESLQTMRIVDAMYRSAEEGKEIIL